MAKGSKLCFISTVLSPEVSRDVFRQAMFGKRPLKMKMSKWKPVRIDPELVAPHHRGDVLGATCVSTGMGTSNLMSRETLSKTLIGSHIAMTAERDSSSGRTTIQLWAAESHSTLGMMPGSVEMGRQFSYVGELIKRQDPSAAVEFE